MDEIEGKARKKPIGWIVLGGILFVVAATATVLLLEPTDGSYRFVTVDHPVDMWSDGGDRWAYFFVGVGKPADLAVKARAELLPLGFTEDKSMTPWFRFVKDKQEVIVCRHGEFAVNRTTAGGTLTKGRRPAGSINDSQCVLVKNGPGTKGTAMSFELKKLIYGW